MQKIPASILAFVFVVLLSARLSAQQPVILRFQPIAAYSSQTVTIVGQNFVNVTNVLLGGVSIRNFTVNNSGDTIRAIVSANAASGLITVVQPSGTATSATAFTFLGCPLILSIFTSVSPSPIPVSSGNVQAVLYGRFVICGDYTTLKVRLNRLGKDTLLTPIKFTSSVINVTIPSVFIREPGTLQFSVVSASTLPVSTTVTVQAQNTTDIQATTPIPERIFPNPASDDITLETTLERPTTLALTITNTLGQHLIRLQQDAPSGLFRTTIPCRQLPPGAYFLEIRSPERRTLHHLIKN
ncbi:MAG: T9SS type A sorting domain-containing protein [Candidatus Kapabacteria bacterium]|nr:T9SS type A sorting domain-containing protein [Candidatus Kapabacteria bacterium]